MLSFTPTAVDAVVFVYVTVDSWLEPGANVCSPGGVAVAEAGVRLSALHGVLGGHDVGLHRLVGGVGRVAGRHHAFVEGALRAVAVVAAVAQDDGALLVHRVVAGVDARTRRTWSTGRPTARCRPAEAQWFGSPLTMAVTNREVMLGRSGQSLDVLPGLTQPTRSFSWSVMIHGPGGGP